MTSSWPDGAARAGQAIRRPLFVIALIVLVLNDGWWKSAWPGLVTGKLSDVAGVVVAAILLTAVAMFAGAEERRAAAVSATTVGALFVLMKTSSWGASVAEAAWTAANGGPNRVVVDPTDLVALVALTLVPRRRPVRARPPTRPRRVVQALASMVLLGGGIAATTATSCAGGDQVTSVVEQDDRLVAMGGIGPLAVSDDHGASWSDAGPPSNIPVPTEPSGSSPRDAPIEACIDDSCWRVEHNELVRHDDGASDGTIELSAVPFYGDDCNVGGRSGRVVSVASFDRPDGSVVLVAGMGQQGIAVSSGDGEWRRVEVGDTALPSGFGERWPPRWVWIPGSLVLSAIGLWAGQRLARSRRRGGRSWVAAVTVPLTVLAALVSLGAGALNGGLFPPTLLLEVIVICTVAITLFTYLGAKWDGPRPPLESDSVVG